MTAPMLTSIHSMYAHWQGRYIVSQPENANLQEFRDALQKEFCEIGFSTIFPASTWKLQADITRLQSELGILQTPTVTSFIDQARSLQALGLAEPSLVT